MRAVIAGGSGFIGKALARHLLGLGYEVAVLGRGGRPSSDPKLRFVVWDGATVGNRAGGWAGELDGADLVVNLCGADIAGSRWTEAYKELLRSSRLNPARTLAEATAAVGTPPKVLIQASAVGYYGDARTPVDESAPRGAGFLADLCGQWEAAGSEVESLGVRRCVIRSGLVLGDGGILARMLPPFRYYAGAVFGSGLQGFPFIHIADEVRAIAFLAGNEGLRGPFNLTSPVAIDQAGFCAALGARLGRPVLWRAPSFAIKAIFGEMGRELLLSGPFARPARLIEAGFAFRFGEIAAALADLVAKPA